MSANSDADPGLGTWPTVNMLTSLNAQDRADYSIDYLFADRVHKILSHLHLSQKPLGLKADNKWDIIMIEYKRLYPNAVGSNCTAGRNFQSRLCRHQKRMRELIAQDRKATGVSDGNDGDTPNDTNQSDLNLFAGDGGNSNVETESKVEKSSGLQATVETKKASMRAQEDKNQTAKPLQKRRSHHRKDGNKNDTANFTKHLSVMNSCPLASVVSRGGGLLTLSTNCRMAPLHQVGQHGKKCVRCGRTPL